MAHTRSLLSVKPPMELTPQILRMTFYGNCDDSGNVWTELKGATDGFDTTTGFDTTAGLGGRARFGSADAGQNAGFAATLLQGDTPRGSAHVA
jgi:hypothetical protein